MWQRVSFRYFLIPLELHTSVHARICQCNSGFFAAFPPGHQIPSIQAAKAETRIACAKACQVAVHATKLSGSPSPGRINFVSIQFDVSLSSASCIFGRQHFNRLSRFRTERVSASLCFSTLNAPKATSDLKARHRKLRSRCRPRRGLFPGPEIESRETFFFHSLSWRRFSSPCRCLLVPPMYAFLQYVRSATS
jgi:hypothetical protein